MLVGAFVGIPSLFVFLKVYPLWRQAQRFRALRLDDVDNMPGREFEHYVARLMQHRGFRTTVTRGSNDFGVDIVAQKDGVNYAIQCKRYSSNLDRTAVSDAVAGKLHYGCSEAVVVTNSRFTAGAQELARSTRCVLVDRDTLSQWVNEFQASSRWH
jgi:restriction system protein